MMPEREQSILVLIDVQGRLHDLMQEKQTLDANLERLLRAAALLKVPVLCTEQIPEKLGSTHEPFRGLLNGAAVIPKTSFSCWGEPRFREALRALQRKQVILCGIETHVCVYQTAMDLLKEGLEVFVAADAVSSRSTRNRELALEAIRTGGGGILPTESILFALLRDAAHADFKPLLNLIK